MDVKEKIIKQVNFYFSDSNLPKDKFLSALTKENEEGWCPIETIASFKRMQQLTKESQVVVDALKESTFLVVSEDGKKVRRKEPLPEIIDFLPRSIYIKGLDESHALEDVEAFVAKHLKEGEKCLCVRMRRFRGGERAGDFKGSVFLELDSEATAQRLLKTEIKATEDAAEPLKIMMKKDYVEKKKAEMAQKKADKKANAGGDNSDKKRKAEPEPEEEKEIVKDLILSISSLNEDTSREDLREVLEGAGITVAFVEYARKMDSGFVRLAEESTLLATAAAKKLTDDNTEIKGSKAVFTALAGEEEEAYWKKVGENRRNAKKKHKQRDGYRGKRN